MLNGKISGSGSTSLTGDYTQAGIWMLDYKAYGENSYVFQDKNIWKSFLESPIAINDKATQELSFNYLINGEGHAGKILGSMYGIEKDNNWEDYPTLDSIINEPSVCAATLNFEKTSEMMFKYLIGHKTLEELNTDSYIQIISKSIYGQSIKADGNSISKPCLLLTGVSNISSDTGVNTSSSGGPCGYITTLYTVFNKSGFYYIDLNNEKVTVAEFSEVSGSNTSCELHHNHGANGPSTQPYSTQTFEINKIVNSVPSQSHTSTCSYNKDTKATVNISFTYIPLQITS